MKRSNFIVHRKWSMGFDALLLQRLKRQ